jgi:hypothetical protein
MMGFGAGANRNTTNFRLESYAATVQQILASMNVNVQNARLPTEEGYGWSFREGSAIIEVYIIQQGDTGYLQVLSPIMHIPQSGLLPLYRRLLELNLQLTSAAFGVFEDVVYVFNERPLDGMDAMEGRSIITLVARYADKHDDELIAEFGGRSYARAQ